MVQPSPKILAVQRIQRLNFFSKAIALLRNLDTARKRKVPETTSLGFVPSKWKDYVVNEEGKIVRKYYELCERAN